MQRTGIRWGRTGIRWGRTGIRWGIVWGVVGLCALGLGQRSEAQPYGMAGCGLGSVIFGNTPGIIQVFAVTTNGIFGSQTFGITTGTSNCVNVMPSAASTRAFIETNREAVAKEISRGSGETIAGLSAVAGCSDSRAVGAALQREFKAIFPSEKASDTAVSGAVIDALKRHPDLGCKNLT